MAGLFYEPLIARYVDKNPRFVERTWLAERVERHLSDPGCRFVLLTAEPGAGKTAFAAWLVRRHPSALRYFIRRDSRTRQSSGDAQSLLLTLGRQLAVLHPRLFDPDRLEITVTQRVGAVDTGGVVIGVRVQDFNVSPFLKIAMTVEQAAETVAGDLVGMDIENLQVEDRLLDVENLQHLALLAPALAQADLDRAGQILVFIDAVDELPYREGQGGVLDWLANCPELPDSLRIVVMSRPGEQQLQRFRDSQQPWLREESIDTTSYEVQVDLGRFVERVTSQPTVAAALAAHRVDPGQFTRQAVARADGNFQYLVALARAIEQAAGHLQPVSGGDQQHRLSSEPDLARLLRLEDVPASMPELYASFLERVKNRVGDSRVEVRERHGQPVTLPAWPALYQPILGLLAVAQEPLDVGQLRELTGVSVGNSWVGNALKHLDQFLERDADGRYRLYHASFAEFMTAPETSAAHPDLCQDPSESHDRVVERALAVRRAGSSWLAASDYLQAHLATHAAGAGRLDELLEDPTYLCAAAPDQLLRVLPAATTSRALASEHLLQRVGPRLRARPIEERAAVLELGARQVGVEWIADRLAELQVQRPWSTQWAHKHPTRTDRLLGAHDGQVEAVAVGEREGRKVVVSGGHDGMLRVWNLRTGEQLLTWRHGEGKVEAVAIGELPDGPVVVSGGPDGKVRRWNLADGTPLGAPLTGHHGGIRSVAVGDFAGLPIIVSGGQSDLAVYVWDLATGQQRYLLTPETESRWDRFHNSVHAVAAGSCYGQPVVVAGHDNGAQLWAWTGSRWTSKVLMHGPSRTVWSVAIGALRARPVAVCGDAHGQLTTWYLDADEPDPHRLKSPDLGIIGVAIGQVGNRALAVTGNYFGRDPGILRVWDLGEHRQPLVGSLDGHHGGVRSLAITQLDDRPVLVSGGFDNDVRVWDLSIALDQQREDAGFRHNHWLLAATLDDVPVVVSQSLAPVEDPTATFDPTDVSTPSVEELVEMARRAHMSVATVRLWNRADGSPIDRHSLRLDSIGHVQAAGVVNDVVLGATVRGRAIQAWNLQTGARVGPVVSAGERFDPAGNLCVGAVGRQAVVAFCDQEARLQVWDVHGGTPVGEPLATYGRGPAACWAIGGPADRPVAAVGTVAKFGIWDLQARRLLAEPPSMQREAHMRGPAAIGQLADHLVVVYSNYGRPIYVWDVETGQERAIHLDVEILSVTIAPDSTIVAGGPAGLLALRVHTSFFAR